VYLLCSRSTASRFAVKRAKGFKEADRRNFLAELQTWIDLPEHANLVPCRFFRTWGDEVLIFAEYVEGGSLKEWIDSRKLYGGGARQALERMLDVAIQFAWGLHCLHELGLVHQDVKPGNVLMGTDGKTALQGVRPRVTDYGLTRARAAAGETFSTDPSRSILVSSGGGTPAYWSPEQAAGLPLTRKTDIWSWGVSVLEMFTGEVTWRSGQGAAEVIEQHLRQGGYDEAIPAMPDRLSELLRQCFREKPPGRPTSLGEVADRLKAIYQESVGRNYRRTLNVIERAALPQTGIKERRTPLGDVWKDPQEWLEMALRAAGRDPAEAAEMVAARGVTRQGELVAEMAVYDEAKRLYLQLVRGGQKELEWDLTILCEHKALVHLTAADLHGALQEYDQAIAIRERLVNQGGELDLALVTAPPENSQITAVAFAQTPLCVALPLTHAAAEKKSIGLQDLAKDEWILFARRVHPIVHDAILDAATREGIAPRRHRILHTCRVRTFVDSAILLWSSPVDFFKASCLHVYASAPCNKVGRPSLTCSRYQSKIRHK
jgi:hypothetical protein